VSTTTGSAACSTNEFHRQVADAGHLELVGEGADLILAHNLDIRCSPPTANSSANYASTPISTTNPAQTVNDVPRHL
jgi:hypothetical protein